MQFSKLHNVVQFSRSCSLKTIQQGFIFIPNVAKHRLENYVLKHWTIKNMLRGSYLYHMIQNTDWKITDNKEYIEYIAQLLNFNKNRKSTN